MNKVKGSDGLYDRRYSEDSMLKGIEIQVDRIVVHKEGCEYVLGIVKAFINELIAWYEDR